MGTRRTHFFSAQRRLSTGVLGVLTALALLLGLLAATTSQAAVLATAAPTRVDLKLLVLDDGSSSMLSIKAELDRQGIPYTDLALGTWDGITTTNFLSQTITTADVPAQSIIEGHYQGVVLPDRQFVSTAAIAALDAYELQFGVRELATYAWPSGGSYGLASTGGVLDGLTTTLTAAAKAPATLNVPAGPFAYLNGSPTFDNNDPAPAAQEVFGYSVTTGASATWTPLVNVTAGGGVPSGAVVGVQTDGSGRQHMLITADSNTGQVWMDILSRGAVSWVTRGVALAYERNYLSMQIDDLFLADDRWNYSQKCTYTGASGSACLLPPSGGATIQMTSADVNYLLSTWQSPVAHAKIKLGFAFNASGAASSTSLVNTFTSPTNLPLFYFVNHTWDHEYLGCLQNAPSETIAWLCYNSSNPPGTVVNPANGPYDLNTADYSWYPELGDSTYTGIIPEITLNKDWAATHLGASWNPNELVTGEHSGLAMTPQQGPDNPALADALTQTQITAIASDASRETGQRTIGSASTVPRHPMDIYYNTSTYQEAVSEYSTIYPGLGLTALADYPDDSTAQARFNSIIVPTVSRIALGSVYTNDPRPFYAHQSNLTGDRVLLPVLNSMLDQHAALFVSPTVQTTLTQQAKILQTQGTWSGTTPGTGDRTTLTALPATTPYLDADGVHIPTAGPHGTIPLTVPTGTTGAAVAVTGFQAYDGSPAAYGAALSGWTNATSTTAAVTSPINVGYKLVPGAPGVPAAAPTAVSGNAQVTLTWPNVNAGGSPITNYLVTPYIGGVAQPTDVSLSTVQAPAGATTTTGTVTGLANGTTYTFTVRAVSALGTGLPSLASNAVIPMTVPAAPTAPLADPGDKSVTLSWVDPTNGGSNIDYYVVTPYKGVTAQPTVQVLLASTTLIAGRRSAVIGSLTNGTAYSFTVAAHNSVNTGPASVNSNVATPQTAPPAVTSVIASNPRSGSVDLSWTQPANGSGFPIVKYVVTPFIGAVGQTPVTLVQSTTSATITGLTNGTSYTFTVTAVNSAPSSSAPSAASNALAPYGAPGAPTAVTATRGDHSAYVSWGAAADNGSVVTGYTVTPYAAGVAQTPLAPAGLGVNITGLTNGVSYTFVVTATNAAGPGTPATSNAVTPSGLPTVVVSKLATTITPVTSAAKVTYSWTATPNGAPITGYQVFVRRAGLGKVVPGAWTLLATTSATKLAIATKPGETLFVSVRATDAVGAVSGYAPSSQQVTVLVPVAKLSLTKKQWTKFGKLDYQATKLGAAAVTPTVAKIRRIYVQAATGVGFGTATVWIGKTKITTLNLAVATKGKIKAKPNAAKLFTVVLTAKQTAHLKGAVIVTVGKAGKLVRLRGVGALR